MFFLLRVGFLSAIPTSTTYIYYATVGTVVINLREYPQAAVAIMPVFCDEGVLHTVADILSQTHLPTSLACLEGFTMRRSYYIVLAATSLGVAWMMP